MDLWLLVYAWGSTCFLLGFLLASLFRVGRAR